MHWFAFVHQTAARAERHFSRASPLIFTTTRQCAETMFTSTNQADTQHATCDSLPLKGTYLDPLLAEVARIGDIVREDARANVKALQQFAASTLGTNLTLYKATDEIMKDEDEDGMYRSGAKEMAAAVLKQFPTKTGGADGGNRDAWGAGVATGVDSSSSAGSSSEAEMVEVELTKVAGKEGHSAGFGFKFETFRDTGTFIFLVKPGLPAAESEQMSRGQRILTVNGTSVSGLIKPDLRTKFRQAGSTLRLALASDAQSYAGRRVSKAPFGGIGCPATLTATFAVAGQNSGVVLAGAPGVGVYVHSVDIDSAAAQTGLLAYTMRVVSINSRDVGTATTPTEAMAWMSQYSACTLVLQHDRLGYRSFLLNDKAASSSRSGQNNGSSSVRYQPPNIKWLFSRSLGSSTGV